MNTWSRCRRCGAINDHDAGACYLCGGSPLTKSCSTCGAGFANPMDLRCPSCGEPYEDSGRIAGAARIGKEKTDAENCGDHQQERYFER